MHDHHDHDAAHAHEGVHEHEHVHVHAEDHDHPHDHEHTHIHSHEHTHANGETHDHPHEHTHTHAHEHHHHAHGEGKPVEELLALMKYMTGHNVAHTHELEKLAHEVRHAGQDAAYDEIMEAVRLFTDGNAALSKALKETVMYNFTFNVPTRINFSKGQISPLSELAESGCRVLLVYGGGSIRRTGIYDTAIHFHPSTRASSKRPPSSP